MASSSLNERLRTGTHAQVAEHLREAIRTSAAASLTSQLLDAIKTGAIPPAVFGAYIDISHDPHALAAAIHQDHSVVVRRAAICRLSKILRSEADFCSTWEALGGAAGIAARMCELSVVDVDLLCRALGSTSGAQGARAERERSMTQLLALLSPLNSSEAGPKLESGIKRDARPLYTSYLHIVKACTAQVRTEWATKEDWPHHIKRRLYLAHAEMFREQEMQAAFSRKDGILRLDGPALFFRQDKSFAERVLARIISHSPDALEIDPGQFVTTLALPLAKHVSRRGTSGKMRERVWGMILEAFERWPKCGEQFEAGFSRSYRCPQPLAKLLVNWWTHAATGEQRANAATICEAFLKCLLRAQALHIRDFPKFLTAAKFRDRFDLLCWLFQYQGQYGFNIASPGEADKAQLQALKHKIPSKLFTIIPLDKALGFLDLLVEVMPGKEFLEIAKPRYSWDPRTILTQAAEPNCSHGDFLILRSFLRASGGGPGSSTDVETEVRERMTKSAQSRNASGRSFWAISALYLCIAHGSLDLFSSVLDWSRRFEKDWEVAGEIRNEISEPVSEAIDLLSGIVLDFNTPVRDAAAVRADIETANEIIVKCIERVMKLREPQRRPATNFWRATLLASHVVNRRLHLINSFQGRSGLSDEATYDIVWEPTLQMLGRIETSALQTHQGKLRPSIETQVLRCDIPSRGHIRDHTWRFLDNLARLRDELWHQERVKRLPAVTTLPNPWPKGLPVHHFFSLPPEKRHKMPYVSSRASNVLFSDPAILLRPPPTEKETVEAIEGFVDDYAVCLKLYIFSQCDDGPKDLEDRTLSAFNDIPGAHTPELQNPPSPSFPDIGNSRSPTEWNPDPYTDVQSKAREDELHITLAQTCLYYMLPASKANADEISVRALAKGQKPLSNWSARSLWRPTAYPRSQTGATRDALIAAAILAINSQHGSDSSLMIHPFPGPEDLRFPALYLADEFLEGLAEAPYMGDGFVELLKEFHRTVPADLLFGLTSSVLSKSMSATDEQGRSLWLAVDLVALLAQSDRPAMACDLIRDFVLDRAEDSSWHRHIFHAGFFSVLSHGEVKQFLGDMVRAIIERLQNGTAIKVTTVKMLANVLGGCKFVDQQTAADILGSILENAGHIDIRAATVSALIDTLTSTKDEKIIDIIVNVLETRAVPIAASMHERYPLTEEAWREAEADNNLPEVGGTTTLDRPIMQLLEVATKHQLSLPQWKDKPSSTLMARVFEWSVNNNRRWMTRFLTHNGFTVHEGNEIAAAPVNIDMINNLVKQRPKDLTPETLDMVRTITMASISPPPAIAAVTAKVRNTPALANSNAGKHWLYLWGNNPTDALGLGAAALALFLNNPRNNPGSELIQAIQSFLVDLANTLIYASEKAALQSLTAHLNTLRDYGEDHDMVACYGAWRERTQPVLIRIIETIDMIRFSLAWRRNVKRVPASLPDTFALRVEMLHLPRSGPPSPPPSWKREREKGGDWDDVALRARAGTEGEIMAKFVGDVKLLVGLLAGGREPYHERWGELKDKVVEETEGVDCLRVAVGLVGELELGVGEMGLGLGLGLEEYLLVELALALIMDAEGDADHSGLARKARDMVSKWAVCGDSWVRDKARAAIESMGSREPDEAGKLWESVEWDREQKRLE
ncbi:hypothetical protein MMYC01_206331 [Madurella mycetomatis]|uniref:Uncharacterized protein n=1 Tax=Madurella mycetomatis TaxID=100816 RepID=A0A175W043_9PEZI|nr:hypothetical protein MMYC01_206331 [Madurella mycetomatis]